MSAIAVGRSHEDAPRVPISEPIAIQDIFISGILDPEEIGDELYRVTAFTNQRSLHDGSLERVVTARLIMSSTTLARLTMVMPAMRCS